MPEDEGGQQQQATQTQTEQTATETKKLAGKFDSPEALETAYKELEKKLGGQAKPKPSTDPTDILSAPKEPAPSEFSSYDDLVKAAGYDTTKLYAKWAEGADLDDFYAKAAKRLGVSKTLAKEITDTKLGAVKSRQEAAMKVAVDAAGGQEKFEALRTFMANLSPDEQAEYRAAVNNPATTKYGIQSLAERYNQSIGAEGSGQLATGNTPPRSGAGFTNFNDYAKALEQKARGKADQATLNKIKNTPQSVIDLANRPG